MLLMASSLPKSLNAHYAFNFPRNLVVHLVIIHKLLEVHQVTVYLILSELDGVFDILAHTLFVRGLLG
jgi:hypothetical protein